MKQIQAGPYQSNSSTDLKREALVNRDLETLSKIREFEKTLSSLLTYYVKQNEIIIRDFEGNEIDPASLPYDLDEIGLHFRSIRMGQIVHESPLIPGELLAEMNFVNRHKNDLDGRILEIPADTLFPIPKDFLWLTMCANQPKQEYSINNHRRLVNHYNGLQ